MAEVSNTEEAMRTSFVVIVVALGAAAFCGGALAADAGTFIGAVFSHHSFEHYDMPVGVTAGQQARRAVRFDEDREVVVVPEHYGTLAGMTSGDDTAASTVLWFRDAAGALRNVVVPGPAQHSYKIQTAATSRYEAEIREK